MVFAIVQNGRRRRGCRRHSCKGGRKVLVVTSSLGDGIFSYHYGSLCNKCEGFMSLWRDEYSGVLHEDPLYLDNIDYLVSGVHITGGENIPRVRLDGN